ncbi:hypothetical protein BGZ60DRAFT_418321 [Tricladium varicosporioides]|nr:hypothetical protein BGZ60DRAFT_418321 [Hymenoscyphus varicosporioides]
MAVTPTEKRKWKQKQDTWVAERRISSHWWRCARCLVRVYVATDGWYCQRCKRNCETPRHEARMPQSLSN